MLKFNTMSMCDKFIDSFPCLLLRLYFSLQLFTCLNCCRDCCNQQYSNCSFIIVVDVKRGRSARASSFYCSLVLELNNPPLNDCVDNPPQWYPIHSSPHSDTLLPNVIGSTAFGQKGDIFFLALKFARVLR